MNNWLTSAAFLNQLLTTGLVDKASRREAGLPYQRIMAVADVLLENAEQVYPMMERWQTRRQEH
jgi:hypothetical protein